jgi:hypothetical protein
MAFMMTNDEIKDLIKRRRGQMLVHSFLYYQMDCPIISDDLWQEWADELTELQTKYPKLCKLDFYDKEFTDWDGSTGMHLPKDIIIEGKARQVVRAYEQYGNL